MKAVFSEYKSLIQPAIGPTIEKINLPTIFFTDKTVALISEEIRVLI